MIFGQMWKALSVLLSRDRDAAARGDVGITYADLERDKERKEDQLSGAMPRRDEADARA